MDDENVTCMAHTTSLPEQSSVYTPICTHTHTRFKLVLRYLSSVSFTSVCSYVYQNYVLLTVQYSYLVLAPNQAQQNSPLESWITQVNLSLPIFVSHLPFPQFLAISHFSFLLLCWHCFWLSHPLYLVLKCNKVHGFEHIPSIKALLWLNQLGNNQYAVLIMYLM